MDLDDRVAARSTSGASELADLLDGFSEPEWATASLCERLARRARSPPT